MRQLFSLLVFALVTAHPGVASANGRYQAIPLDPGYEFGTEKALLLDTVAGHMWIWIESPAIDARGGGRYVIYQGQLTPGKAIGDVILKQEWPAEKHLK
jgi:hypothetical protein